MKESIGNAMVFGIFVTFAFLTMLILTISINYSRASKIKDRLLTYVQTYAENNAKINSDGTVDIFDFSSEDIDFRDKVELELASLGYRRNTSLTGVNECPVNDNGDEFSNEKLVNEYSAYKYCIYAKKTSRGYYYRVVTYMYFDIPIIGSTLEFPISGETKVIYSLEGK